MSEAQSGGIRVRANITRTSKWAPSWDVTVEVNSEFAITDDDVGFLIDDIERLRAVVREQVLAEDQAIRAHFEAEANGTLALQLQDSVEAIPGR